MFVSESSSGGDETVGVTGDGGVEEGDDMEPDDDQAEFHAADDQSTHPAVQPRWPTRVFAAECVRRIIVACEGNKSAHFNLALAKEMQLTKSRGGSCLLFIISYTVHWAPLVAWLVSGHSPLPRYIQNKFVSNDP
jgi:hypothetical protein